MINRRRNNPENPFTTKVGKHIISGFSVSTMSSLKSIENKHEVYIGKHFTKKFFEALFKHAMNITDFKKKKYQVINKRAAGITWK